jgi:hypothetical protein
MDEVSFEGRVGTSAMLRLRRVLIASQWEVDRLRAEVARLTRLLSEAKEALFVAKGPKAAAARRSRSEAQQARRARERAARMPGEMSYDDIVYVNSG